MFKQIIPSPMKYLDTFVKNQLIINLRLSFSTISSSSLIFITIFMSILHCFNYYIFIVSFKFTEVSLPTLIFFSWLFQSLFFFFFNFHANFRISSYISTKSQMGLFDREDIKSINKFEKYYHLNNIKILNLRISDVFYLDRSLTIFNKVL